MLQTQPSRILLAMLIGTLLVTAAIQCVTAFALIGYRGDVSHPESAEVSIALHWAQEGQLYRPLDKPPFTPVAYGPAFYGVLAALAAGGNLGLDGLLVAARVLSVCAFFGIAVLVYIVGRRRYGRIGPAIAALLVLANPNFAGWNATARPDVPAVLLGLMALAIADPKEGSCLRAAIAGALATFVLLMKVAYVAPIAAILALYMVHRRRGDAAVFITSLLLSAGAIIAIFAMKGESLVRDLFIQSNVAVTREALFNCLVEQWHFGTPALLAIAAIGLWAELSADRLRRADIVPFATYFFVAWLVAVLISRNAGSSNNYYLEPIVATALLASPGLRALGEEWRGASEAWRAVALFLGLIAAISMVGRPVGMLLHSFSAQEETVLADIAQGRPVWSDDSYVAVRGGSPEMLDPFLAHSLEDKHKWSSQPIVESVQHQKYDLVILRTTRGVALPYNGYLIVPPAVLRAIAANYRVVCSTADRTVLAPVSRPTPLTSHQVSELRQAGCFDAGPYADQQLFEYAMR